MFFIPGLCPEGNGIYHIVPVSMHAWKLNNVWNLSDSDHLYLPGRGEKL